MFENLSHLALQQYWWMIVSLLGSLLVFLLFVQGGQTLIYRLGKDDTQRTLLINVLGRKWEFTFTTLVTFGGAFFASFPLFYSFTPFLNRKRRFPLVHCELGRIPSDGLQILLVVDCKWCLLAVGSSR